jgi:hypothetical protein
MSAEQKVVFKVTSDGNMTITFDPELAGEESEQYAQMSGEEKTVQGFASHIGGKIIESINELNQ